MCDADRSRWVQSLGKHQEAGMVGMPPIPRSNQAQNHPRGQDRGAAGSQCGHDSDPPLALLGELTEQDP